MKTKISIFLLFFFTITLFGQSNRTIDSLKQSLTKVGIHDTAHVSTNLMLGKIYLSIDLGSMYFFVNNALKLSLQNDNYRLDRIYSAIGLNHFYNSNIDSARYYYDKALIILDRKDDL